MTVLKGANGLRRRRATAGGLVGRWFRACERISAVRHIRRNHIHLSFQVIAFCRPEGQLDLVKSNKDVEPGSFELRWGRPGCEVPLPAKSV